MAMIMGEIIATVTVPTEDCDQITYLVVEICPPGLLDAPVLQDGSRYLASSDFILRVTLVCAQSLSHNVRNIETPTSTSSATGLTQSPTLPIIR